MLVSEGRHLLECYVVRLARSNITEDCIIHSHRRRNLKSYMLELIRSVFQLLVTAQVFPRSLILSNLMIEAVRSSETSALTIALRRHVHKYDII
jgi:hypothetical protein